MAEQKNDEQTDIVTRQIWSIHFGKELQGLVIIDQAIEQTIEFD